MSIITRFFGRNVDPKLEEAIGGDSTKSEIKKPIRLTPNEYEKKLQMLEGEINGGKTYRLWDAAILSIEHGDYKRGLNYLSKGGREEELLNRDSNILKSIKRVYQTGDSKIVDAAEELGLHSLAAHLTREKDPIRAARNYERCSPKKAAEVLEEIAQDDAAVDLSKKHELHKTTGYLYEKIGDFESAFSHYIEIQDLWGALTLAENKKVAESNFKLLTQKAIDQRNYDIVKLILDQGRVDKEMYQKVIDLAIERRDFRQAAILAKETGDFRTEAMCHEKPAFKFGMYENVPVPTVAARILREHGDLEAALAVCERHDYSDLKPHKNAGVDWAAYIQTDLDDIAVEIAIKLKDTEKAKKFANRGLDMYKNWCNYIERVLSLMEKGDERKPSYKKDLIEFSKKAVATALRVNDTESVRYFQEIINQNQ